MNLENYLEQSYQDRKANRLATSGQITLGQLIEKMEVIVKNHAERATEGKEEAEVRYDFEYLFPTDFDSWRGIYAELALNFNMNDRSGEEQVEPLTAIQFLALCKKTLGATFFGYKGGEYRMDENTPIWVANYGNSGSTALLDVVDGGYIVILITGYVES